MRLSHLQLLAMALTLNACATTSFAPQPVPTGHELQSSARDSCEFKGISSKDKINPGVLGALVLIDNYRRVYSCAAREAADGRQIFQIPSLLAAVTAGVGPTFGLHNNGAIAALTSSAILERGNAYYSPTEKSAVIAAARDAVNCVGGAAVGMDFFDTRVRPTAEDPAIALARAEALAEVVNDRIQTLHGRLDTALTLQRNVEMQSRALDGQNAESRGAGANIVQQAADLKAEQAALGFQIAQLQGDSARIRSEVQSAKAALEERGLMLRMDAGNGDYIELDVNRVYFERVKVTLDAIDTALADRLRNAGTYDRASLIKEIQDLAREESEIKADADEEAEEDEAQTQQLMSLNGLTDQQRREDIYAAQQRKAVRSVKVDLETLKPRFDTCIARSKIK